MTAGRKKLTKDERHAAAILMITRGNGTPIVTREEAKAMTPKEIIEAFAARTHVEHIVPHAITQNDHPSNIQYLTPDEHEPKTKRDVTEIAKTKRIEKAHAEFRRKILAKVGQNHDPSIEESSISRTMSRLKSRPFPKRPSGMKTNWGRRRMAAKGKIS